MLIESWDEVAHLRLVAYRLPLGYWLETENSLQSLGCFGRGAAVLLRIQPTRLEPYDLPSRCGRSSTNTLLQSTCARNGATYQFQLWDTIMVHSTPAISQELQLLARPSATFFNSSSICFNQAKLYIYTIFELHPAIMDNIVLCGYGRSSILADHGLIAVAQVEMPHRSNTI